MTFGFPLGLLALGALVPLVAAYFLRRRQPPRIVSALFLWRTPDQRAEAGPRLQRFSRELSLLLETAAVVLAALFLADAQCGAHAARRHVVVVVDGSLSMSAKVGSSTVADEVRAAVAKLAGSEQAGVMTIIESGLRPTVLAGPQLETQRALSQLEAWKPAQPSHDVTAALLAAKELAASDQRIHFFTDGPLPEAVLVPPQVEVRSLGRSQPNAALLSAQRRDEDGVAQVTVRVGNFSSTPRTVPVQFVAEDGAHQEQSVQLGADGSAVLRLSLKTISALDVKLPDDALELDNHVTLLPSPVTEVTVGLLEGLDASARAALTRFLSVAPGVRLGEAATLTVGPAGSNGRITIGAKGTLKSFVGPFFSQKGDPLLDDVQLGGVVWTAGDNPPGRALASAGDVVLLSEEDDGAVHVNVELARSDVQRTAAWPVLLSNLLRQARQGMAGLPRKHLMLGEDVPVVTTAGSTWELQGPQGQHHPVLGLGALAVPAVTSPGRWELLKDGKRFDACEVLPLDAHESDLQTRGPYAVDSGVGEALASLALKRPRAAWPIVAVLALLLTNFWLTTRRTA